MENLRIAKIVQQLEKEMQEEGIDSCCGLPESLFLLVSSLTPIVNIDLLITDYKKGVLLTWRDDPFYGRGWHIPGGCVRMKETLDKRIQITALKELGTTVNYHHDPIAVREAMINVERPWLHNQLYRSHNISFLYLSTLPSGYCLYNNGLNEHVSGYMKWFTDWPDDLLACHRELYGDILEKYIIKGGYSDE